MNIPRRIGEPKNNNGSVKLTSLITYLNPLTLDKKPRCIFKRSWWYVLNTLSELLIRANRTKSYVDYIDSPVILFFNSVVKRLQFEWFKLLLSVPFLQLEWGLPCSDISFWAVKQVLAVRSQLCACIINWMDCRQIDRTGCDFAPTDNSELTQQDGRQGRRRQTLCDKRDNNFVCNNFSPNFTFL